MSNSGSTTSPTTRVYRRVSFHRPHLNHRNSSFAEGEETKHHGAIHKLVHGIERKVEHVFHHQNRGESRGAVDTGQGLHRPAPFPLPSGPTTSTDQQKANLRWMAEHSPMARQTSNSRPSSPTTSTDSIDSSPLSSREAESRGGSYTAPFREYNDRPPVPFPRQSAPESPPLSLRPTPTRQEESYEEESNPISPSSAPPNRHQSSPFDRNQARAQDEKLSSRSSQQPAPSPSAPPARFNRRDESTEYTSAKEDPPSDEAESESGDEPDRRNPYSAPQFEQPEPPTPFRSLLSRRALKGQPSPESEQDQAVRPRLRNFEPESPSDSDEQTQSPRYDSATRDRSLSPTTTSPTRASDFSMPPDEAGNDLDNELDRSRRHDARLEDSRDENVSNVSRRELGEETIEGTESRGGGRERQTLEEEVPKSISREEEYQRPRNLQHNSYDTGSERPFIIPSREQESRREEEEESNNRDAFRPSPRPAGGSAESLAFNQEEGRIGGSRNDAESLRRQEEQESFSNHSDSSRRNERLLPESASPEVEQEYPSYGSEEVADSSQTAQFSPTDSTSEISRTKPSDQARYQRGLDSDTLPTTQYQPSDDYASPSAASYPSDDYFAADSRKPPSPISPAPPPSQAQFHSNPEHSYPYSDPLDSDVHTESDFSDNDRKPTKPSPPSLVRPEDAQFKAGDDVTTASHSVGKDRVYPEAEGDTDEGYDTDDLGESNSERGVGGQSDGGNRDGRRSNQMAQSTAGQPGLSEEEEVNDPFTANRKPRPSLPQSQSFNEAQYRTNPADHDEPSPSPTSDYSTGSEFSNNPQQTSAHRPRSFPLEGNSYDRTEDQPRAANDLIEKGRRRETAEDGDEGYDTDESRETDGDGVLRDRSFKDGGISSASHVTPFSPQLREGIEGSEGWTGEEQGRARRRGGDSTNQQEVEGDGTFDRNSYDSANSGQTPDTGFRDEGFRERQSWSPNNFAQQSSNTFEPSPRHSTSTNDNFETRQEPPGRDFDPSSSPSPSPSPSPTRKKNFVSTSFPGQYSARDDTPAEDDADNETQSGGTDSTDSEAEEPFSKHPTTEAFAPSDKSFQPDPRTISTGLATPTYPQGEEDTDDDFERDSGAEASNSRRPISQAQTRPADTAAGDVDDRFERNGSEAGTQDSDEGYQTDSDVEQPRHPIQKDTVRSREAVNEREEEPSDEEPAESDHLTSTQSLRSRAHLESSTTDDESEPQNEFDSPSAATRNRFAAASSTLPEPAAHEYQTDSEPSGDDERDSKPTNKAQQYENEEDYDTRDTPKSLFGRDDFENEDYAAPQQNLQQHYSQPSSLSDEDNDFDASDRRNDAIDDHYDSSTKGGVDSDQDFGGSDAGDVDRGQDEEGEFENSADRSTAGRSGYDENSIDPREDEASYQQDPLISGNENENDPSSFSDDERDATRTKDAGEDYQSSAAGRDNFEGNNDNFAAENEGSSGDTGAGNLDRDGIRSNEDDFGGAGETTDYGGANEYGDSGGDGYRDETSARGLEENYGDNELGGDNYQRGGTDVGENYGADGYSAGGGDEFAGGDNDWRGGGNEYSQGGNEFGGENDRTEPEEYDPSYGQGGNPYREEEAENGDWNGTGREESEPYGEEWGETGNELGTNYEENEYPEEENEVGWDPAATAVPLALAVHGHLNRLRSSREYTRAHRAYKSSLDRLHSLHTRRSTVLLPEEEEEAVHRVFQAVHELRIVEEQEKRKVTPIPTHEDLDISSHDDDVYVTSFQEQTARSLEEAHEKFRDYNSEKNRLALQLAQKIHDAALQQGRDHHFRNVTAHEEAENDPQASSEDLHQAAVNRKTSASHELERADREVERAQAHLEQCQNEKPKDPARTREAQSRLRAAKQQKRLARIDLDEANAHVDSTSNTFSGQESLSDPDHLAAGLLEHLQAVEQRHSAQLLVEERKAELREAERNGDTRDQRRARRAMEEAERDVKEAEEHEKRTKQNLSHRGRVFSAQRSEELAEEELNDSRRHLEEVIRRHQYGGATDSELDDAQAAHDRAESEHAGAVERHGRARDRATIGDLNANYSAQGQEAAERLLRYHETRVQALEAALEREPSNEEARAKLEKHLRDRHLAAAVFLDSHESNLAEARERLAQNLNDLTARRAFEEATRNHEEAVEAQRSTGKEADRRDQRDVAKLLHERLTRQLEERQTALEQVEDEQVGGLATDDQVEAARSALREHLARHVESRAYLQHLDDEVALHHLDSEHSLQDRQEAAERLLRHHETRVQALQAALESDPSNEEARAKLEKHLRDRHLAAAVLLDSHESKLAEARERLAQNLSDLTARRAFEEATRNHEEAVEAQRSTGRNTDRKDQHAVAELLHEHLTRQLQERQNALEQAEERREGELATDEEVAAARRALMTHMARHRESASRLQHLDDKVALHHPDPTLSEEENRRRHHQAAARLHNHFRRLFLSRSQALSASADPTDQKRLQMLEKRNSEFSQYLKSFDNDAPPQQRLTVSRARIDDSQNSLELARESLRQAIEKHRIFPSEPSRASIEDSRAAVDAAQQVYHSSKQGHHERKAEHSRHILSTTEAEPHSDEHHRLLAHHHRSLSGLLQHHKSRHSHSDKRQQKLAAEVQKHRSKLATLDSDHPRHESTRQALDDVETKLREVEDEHRHHEEKVAALRLEKKEFKHKHRNFFDRKKKEKLANREEREEARRKKVEAERERVQEEKKRRHEAREKLHEEEIKSRHDKEVEAHEKELLEKEVAIRKQETAAHTKLEYAHEKEKHKQEILANRAKREKEAKEKLEAVKERQCQDREEGKRKRMAEKEKKEEERRSRKEQRNREKQERARKKEEARRLEKQRKAQEREAKKREKERKKRIPSRQHRRSRPGRGVVVGRSRRSR